MLSKQCTKCKIDQLIDNFYRRGSGRYQSWCKECTANPRFKQKLPTPEQRKATLRRYYDRHPDKIKLKIGYHRERNRYRQQVGLCVACMPGIALPNESVCLFCWVMILIRTLCTRCKQPLTLVQRKQLATILMHSIPIHCPYTGEPVLPGINLHLDHKLPLKERPDLAFNLDNLQWVSKAYNYCKWDMSDTEFTSKYKLTYIGDS